MLALDRKAVKLTNVALRRERHGDKWALAGTLSFKMIDSSAILDLIDPQVRAGLYRTDVIGMQKTIDGSQPAMPRSEYIKHVPLDLLVKDAEITLHWGASGDADLDLYKVKLDSFGLDVTPGGSPPLEFKAKCPLDVVECASLATLWLDEDISISIRKGDAAQLELGANNTGDAGVGDSDGEID
jgi:hypothetical protein